MSKTPWDDPDAIEWAQNSTAVRELCRLVEGTLRLETKKHPHEIRAAAATVIMLCRKNLWSTRDRDDDAVQIELDRIVSLAARQLVQIKQLFELNANSKPEMQSNKTYRNLLVSLDEEIRILEARMTDPKPTLPEQPPCTWGDFWF
jgi:hypothetical protein